MSENKKYEVYATRGTTEFLGHVEAGTREEYIQKAEELLDAYSSEPEAHNCAELGDPNLILDGFGPEEEPKKRKYNTLEEFFKKSEWSLIEKRDFSTRWSRGLYLIVIHSRDDFKKIAKEFSFEGRSRQECEQNVLEWANDEI